MAMKPGERQAERSRTALKVAFEQLLDTKGYGGISVGEIADAANIGRSTFYRHFKSKADVLVALHEDIFDRLFLRDSSRAQWIEPNPPQPLREFLCRHRMPGGQSVSLTNDLGADMDYLMRNVGQLLSIYISRSLQQAFPDQEPSIPLAFLSSTVAATYGMALLSWRGPLREAGEAELAEYIHRLTRAAVMEAYDE